jgi:putative hemolysin
MNSAQRVKFSFRRGRRRWGFSRRHIIVPRRMRFGTRGNQDATASSITYYEPMHAPRPLHVWPVLASSGPLEVRLAETPAEIEAAQRLRYRVFYEEMSAIPTPQMRAERRDFDRFDDFCDHILVVDRDVADENGDSAVVGTYRLLRGEVAALQGGYYTSSEYDLTSMLRANPPGTRFVELGRSCVLKAYRSKAITMQLLWKGVMVYVARYSVDVMFGCGSLPGTDPDALALQLSYLHHFHRAPEGARVRARPELYVEMNRIPLEEIDAREALRKLPPLIKGYVRAGTYIGDGAVVDKQFGTTDVLIYFPVSQIDPRFRSRFADKSS